MIIYQALYCPCIHESGYLTLSTHKTKEGAEKAIETHKNNLKAEWQDWGESMCKSKIGYATFEEFEKRHPFARFENWKVFEVTLLD